MRIPRGDSEVGDGFLWGEGFVPGGSFADWIESGIFDEGVAGDSGAPKTAREGDGDDPAGEKVALPVAPPVPPDPSTPSDLPADGSSSDAKEPVGEGASTDVGASEGTGLSEAFARRSEGSGRSRARRRPRAALLAGACLVALAATGGAWLAFGPAGAGGDDDADAVVASSSEDVARQLLPTPSLPVRLSEADLNEVVAVYVRDGIEHEVTARDVRSSQREYPPADSQGRYPAPTTEEIGSCVLELILVEEAREAGVEVSGKEAAARSRALFGSDDYDFLARSFGVSSDELRASVEADCAVEKLKGLKGRSAGIDPPDPLIGESATGASKGSEGDFEDGTKGELGGYGAYIVALAGDEWDAEAGVWARADGPYLKALGEDFDPSQATYDQAVAAYSLAVDAAGDSGEWEAYLDEVRADVTVLLQGLL